MNSERKAGYLVSGVFAVAAGASFLLGASYDNSSAQADSRSWSKPQDKSVAQTFDTFGGLAISVALVIAAGTTVKRRFK